MSLILTWAILLSIIILMYIVLDGFDLGVGIIFPFIKNTHYRDIMMSTVAPVWDGNGTYLVLGAAALYGAFPMAYGILIPALYMPVMIMVSALIFRGVAFEFRFQDEKHQHIWDIAFSLGSTITGLMQGIILGRFVQGYGAVTPQVPHSYNWITPFSVLTGCAVVIGYAMLGANWLIWKTEGPLQDKLFSLSKRLAGTTAILLGTVCLGALLVEPRILEQWIAYRTVLWIIPVVTASLFIYQFYCLHQRQDMLPFFLAIGIFICSYVGFGASVWPYVIPHNMTFWEAAAPESSLQFSLVGFLIILPILIGYTSYAYYVFRGKVTESIHY
jgi:cytochrome bd ubiquinol oxidase subunit II